MYHCVWNFYFVKYCGLFVFCVIVDIGMETNGDVILCLIHMHASTHTHTHHHKDITYIAWWISWRFSIQNHPSPKFFLSSGTWSGLSVHWLPLHTQRTGLVQLPGWIWPAPLHQVSPVQHDRPSHPQVACKVCLAERAQSVALPLLHMRATLCKSWGFLTLTFDRSEKLGFLTILLMKKDLVVFQFYQFLRCLAQ